MSTNNNILIQKAIETYEKYKDDILQKQKNYRLEQQTIEYNRLQKDINIIRDAISKYLPSELEIYIPNMAHNNYKNTWGYTELSLYVLFNIPNSNPIAMTIPNGSVGNRCYYRVVASFSEDMFNNMIPKYDTVIPPTEDVYLAIGRGIELKEELLLQQKKSIERFHTQKN